MNNKIYGTLPIDMGKVELNPAEMMFWMYCPIKAPNMTQTKIPENLMQYQPLIALIKQDRGSEWKSDYVYITAKTLYVTPESTGNRAGWHSDGYLTNDINYIWSDTNPTVFFDDSNLHEFSQNHNDSMHEMAALCSNHAKYQVRFENKHLLKLDQYVLHKVDTNIQAGMRTFVKISVSKNIYALKGNSINHKLCIAQYYQNRQLERNCPTGANNI
jgi:hypothetical protein